MRACLFEISGQAFALPVEAVEEVFALHGCTRVPGAPAWVLGATSRRGRVLPILLPPGIVPAPLAGPGTQVLVIADRDRRAAVPIDRTHGIQEACAPARDVVEVGGRRWRLLQAGDLLRRWEEAMRAHLREARATSEASRP